MSRLRNNLEVQTVYCPSGIRCRGWRDSCSGLVWNAGTCRFGDKGENQMGKTHENESTNTKHRDGTTRSSDETSVMEVERRCRVVWCCSWDQPLLVGGIF